MHYNAPFTRPAQLCLWLPVLFILLSLRSLHAQAPANDDCVNASVINLNGGYTLGTFTSDKSDLSQATTEQGESFHKLHYYVGNDKKSVWYKFVLPSRRSVSIELRQRDTLIAQNAVGFSVYKINPSSGSQLPPNLGELSADITTITKFGASGSTCLGAGEYLVQVCAHPGASADIWLQLKLEIPSPAPFDEPGTPFELGTAKGTINTGFDIGCYSLSDPALEKCAALDNNYTQTAWVTFTTDNYSDHVSLAMWPSGFRGGPEYVKIGCNLFEGNCKSGTSSLQLIDGCNIYSSQCKENSWAYSCNGYGYTDWQCKLKPNTTYTLLIFCHKDADFKLGLYLSEAGDAPSKSADPKKLPAAYKLGTLPLNGWRQAEDQFACNSKMKDFPCGNIVRDNLVDSTLLDAGSSKERYRRDTLDMNLWTTFSIAKPSRLIMILEYFDDYYNRWTTAHYNINSGVYIRIYNGDIEKDCNLPLFQSMSLFGDRDIVEYRIGKCLPAGTYSVQLLGRTTGVSGLYAPHLGTRYRITFRAGPMYQQKPSKYNRPDNPEDLGNITPKLKGGGFASDVEYFGHNDTKIVLDKVEVTGRIIYRQFYLDEPTRLLIREENRKFHYMPFFLLSGKVSDGISGLKQVEYDPYFNSGYADVPYDTHYVRSTCTPLPKGWYTIIQSIPSIQCNDTTIYDSKLWFRKYEYCKPKYQYPSRAASVNNGKALSWGPGKGSDPKFQDYAVTYTLPKECFECADNKGTIQRFLPPCVDSFYYWGTGDRKQEVNRVAYYVFRIEKESYARIRVGKEYSGSGDYLAEYDRQLTYLYDFDVRKDSALLKDTSHLMKPCGKDLNFCRLQPGVYTLVVFGTTLRAIEPKITLDRITDPVYDHAAGAADMGIIPPDGVAKTSAAGFFTCITGAQAGELDSMYSHYAGHQGGVWSRDTASVPYPMPPNYNMHYATRRTLWFTFSLPGTGKATVTLNPLLYKKDKERLPALIYRSDEPGKIPYTQLVKDGKVDSTLLQGLTYIDHILVNGGTPPNIMSFDKRECDTARYYVIVDKPYWQSEFDINQAVSVSVKFEGVNLPLTGDRCATAVPMNLPTSSMLRKSTTVNCHTIGGDFGEDGSNLGCLAPKPEGYKTSWFKVTLQSGQRSDLAFSITNYTSARPDQVRFRVLYGDCKALTPGPCLESGLSSFRLDCMSPGDYYVQVLTPYDATGTVELEATATPTTYPICKPADLNKPLANFSYRGGCNGDPVEFINLSTSGEDISYFWKLGDGATSTEKAPVHTYTGNKAVDTFFVTLTVRNTRLNTADSLRLPVYIFRDPIVLTLQRNISIHCGSAVQISASTNYPKPVITWTPETGLDNPYILTPKVKRVTNDITYYIRVKAGNCELTDSVRIKINRSLTISGSRMICNGKPVLLKLPLGYSPYRWSDGLYTAENQRLISKPGKYWVQAYYEQGECYDVDTVIISDEQKQGAILGGPHVLCPGDSIKLDTRNPDALHEWSTGQTGKISSVWVSKPGIYKVKVIQDSCQFTDSTEVKVIQQALNLGPDVKLCSDQGYLIKADMEADSFLWNTGARSHELWAAKTGQYILKAWKNGCQAEDSVFVKITPNTGASLGPDTVICDWPISLPLDAGPGASYLWRPGGETTRRITATQAGRYSVIVTDADGCTAADTIMLLEDCEPVLFVPNAFTPAGGDWNERFKAEGSFVTTYQMQVFNRWGERLWETQNLGEGWDGTYHGQPCQQDVYLYVIHYTGKRTTKYLSGTFHLLR